MPLWLRVKPLPALARLCLLASLLILASPAAEPPTVAARPAARVAIDGRLAGKSPAEALALFSKYAPPGEFVRSRNCWAADIDLSGVSVWNSANLDATGGNRGYGTLISRRHLVFAQHFHPGPGTMLAFLDRAGTLVWRRLGETAQVGKTDICLGVLTEDVPATVASYPILPAGFNLARAAGDQPLPLLCLNQNRQALVQEWLEIPSPVVLHRLAIDPARVPFTGPLIIGDSGAPIFLLLGKQPILLGCNFTANSAPALAAYAREIEATMQTLGGKAALRRADWR